MRLPPVRVPARPTRRVTPLAGDFGLQQLLYSSKLRFVSLQNAVVGVKRLAGQGCVAEDGRWRDKSVAKGEHP
jgi:hypothetical protein